MGRELSGVFVDDAGRHVRWVQVGGDDGDVRSLAGAFTELVDGDGTVRLRRHHRFGVVWSALTVVGPPLVRWPRIAVGCWSVTVCWRWRLVMLHAARASAGRRAGGRAGGV